MKSFEALNRAIDRHTVEHARKLGLSTSLINKWQEPHKDYEDSGAYNPLDRIETVIETSLALGNAPAAAYAPIQYLTELFGLIFIETPKVTGSTLEIQRELLATISEFGDMAQAAGKALADGKLCFREAAEIEREAWQLIRQAAAFMQAVREAAR